MSSKGIRGEWSPVPALMLLKFNRSSELLRKLSCSCWLFKSMFLFARERSMRGLISSCGHLAEEAKVVVVSQTPAVVVVSSPLVWCVRVEVVTGAEVLPGEARSYKQTSPTILHPCGNI